MGGWSRLVAPLLVDFANVADSGRLLDVGSGTGSLAFALAEGNPRCHVLGIDPSQEYVAYATSRNSFADRVSFQVGNAQELQLPDASFESSLSLLVFNFIPNPGKALKEARRNNPPRPLDLGRSGGKGHQTAKTPFYQTITEYIAWCG